MGNNRKNLILSIPLIFLKNKKIRGLFICALFSKNFVNSVTNSKKSAFQIIFFFIHFLSKS
ncbi:hypothetical protein A1D19_02045 [Lonepinella koalarum]|nr:hypothetical protein [Lonepinella koalarum]